MDHQRSTSGNGEDAVGIPDDLRCKRSDGKQWRCTAMSMPDKTVCEKHYIQAKRRAANSAMRANLKKKKKSLGESDIYVDSKNDHFEMPLVNNKIEDYPLSVLAKKAKEKAANQTEYSPDTPSIRSSSIRETMKLEDDTQRDGTQFEENCRSFKTPLSAMDSSWNRSQRRFDDVAVTAEDSNNASDEGFGGQTCHQCQRNDRERVTWCLKCDRRGYCDSCLSTWYSDVPLEDIEKACPACRGSCNCKVCLRADNMIKVRIREIPVLEKLQYLYFLLSSVLPIVRKIHHEQCSEVELEKKLRGIEIDLFRVKLNADEQMCCNFCRIPIIDYHRHCARCSYDLCLSCCQELREAPMHHVSREVESQPTGRSQDKESALWKTGLSRSDLNLLNKFPEWKANSDGSIPCPPKEYGGCGHVSLNLHRIFKMNWVAKLVKNVDEMVSGCKVYNVGSPQKTMSDDCRLCKFANREGSDDNFLYCPSVDDIRVEGISDFRKHWIKGEPVIVEQVVGDSSVSSWDPTAIWRGISETSDEKIKDDTRMVKAINFLDGSEVDIELGQFINGYSEGRINENGEVEILKLKDWPSPSASEEFLVYQRPEFISKLPLLEYIHSRLGLLNVAAKLPHYSLQNDVGPKIFISYGTTEELIKEDSVTKLHFKMRDMVYILVHTYEVKLKGHQKTKINKLQKSNVQSNATKSLGHCETMFGERRLPDVSLSRADMNNEYNVDTAVFKNDKPEDRVPETRTSEVKTMHIVHADSEDISGTSRPGASWDVFRRQDVPKLVEYLCTLCKDFAKPESAIHDFVTRPLYDEVVYLNDHHKRKLKEEYGVEPWSFEQCLGQAVFIPAGCPFQMRNLLSNVQVGLDFLFPESVGAAVSMAGEIRCLPNDHEAKLQILEVGKISLYAASSAIKDVQKLVLDPKLGAELGFEDPNLTAAVSENLEKFDKRRHITCP